MVYHNFYGKSFLTMKHISEEGVAFMLCRCYGCFSSDYPNFYPASSVTSYSAK